MTLLTYNQRTFSVLNLNSTGSRTHRTTCSDLCYPAPGSMELARILMYPTLLP